MTSTQAEIVRESMRWTEMETGNGRSTNHWQIARYTALASAVVEAARLTAHLDDRVRTALDMLDQEFPR